MNQLNAGDVVLLVPEDSNRVGQMVADATGSAFSHVVMVYSTDAENDIYQVIELTKEGVHLTNMDQVVKIEDDEPAAGEYNAYVMRPKEGYDIKTLIQTAEDMLNQKNIGYDLTGLFILQEFIEIHKKINFDALDVENVAEILLMAAEFILAAEKIDNIKNTNGSYETKMHCAQFIYNLLHGSSKRSQLVLNGGVFFNDFKQNDDMKREFPDKVDYLTKLLTDKLAEEPPFSGHKEPSLIHQRTTMINWEEYEDAKTEFKSLMNSEYPIASSLVTVEDFMNYAENLDQVGYFNVHLDRDTEISTEQQSVFF